MIVILVVLAAIYVKMNDGDRDSAEFKRFENVFFYFGRNVASFTREIVGSKAADWLWSRFGWSGYPDDLGDWANFVEWSY